MANNGGTNVGGIYYDVTLETGGVIEGRRVIERETQTIVANLNRITMAVKQYAIIQSMLKSAEAADGLRLLAARVEVAAGSANLGTAAMQRLVEMSKRTNTAVADNVQIFARLNASLIQMGGTQDDTLRITELIGKAIKVSGANAEEAKAGLLQFGQALGSGKLQGDEFRSLMENAPYLMKQMANGIGVPIGALKNLSTQGKLTSSVIVNALTKAAGSIEADFAKFPQTVSGSFTVAQDAFGRLNLQLDEASGKSAIFAGAGKGVAQVLDELTKQLTATNAESSKLDRNAAVKTWADRTKLALSYVVDAADVTWRVLSKMTRDAVFAFEDIGSRIIDTARAAKAVATGDFAGARAISAQMDIDAQERRKKLADDNKDALDFSKTAGAKMRAAWAAPPEKAPAAAAASKIKDPVDADAARKLLARREAAKAYYEGLVADSQTAMAKIDTEERKALSNNAKHMAEDKANADIYAKAKTQIMLNYARQRAQLEEQTNQQIGELNIEMTTDEMAKIEAIRTEALRRADATERLGEKTPGDAQRERTRANFEATQALADIAERNARARADAQFALTKSQEQRIAQTRDETVRQAEEAYRRGKATFEETEAAKTKAVQEAVEQQKALEVSRTTTRIDTLQVKAASGGSQAQEDLIRAQAAAQIKAVEETRLKDLEASQIYAEQKVAIEADMQQKIFDLRANANAAALTSTSDAFGSIVGVLKNTAGEQTGIFKVMFAAQKAFSIASSIVSIQQGIANASSLPFPANLAAMATVAAATASIISTISNTNYGGGRQYGGPVSADSLYRVGEKGPEMFVGSGGQHYMLPGQSGSVTPSGQAGGGTQLHVQVINNHPAASVDVQRDDSGRMARVIIAEVASQVSTRSGPIWSALHGTTNLRGKQ